MQEYPLCKKKIEWMTAHWRSDPCYETHGVNGTECSIMFYLSEVEVECPVLHWRPTPTPRTVVLERKTRINATLRTDIGGLMNIMDEAGEKVSWLKTRITRMWDSKWMPAVDNILKKGELTNRERKKIFIHMGFLDGSSNAFVKGATSGGPLGELVQWSDIIASLYILGHDIEVSVNSKLISFRQQAIHTSCPNAQQGDSDLFDLVYTDISGMRQVQKTGKSIFAQTKCKLRVIDSFGTDPSYNSHKYMQRTGRKSIWGGWNLNTMQFFTMFPHSPDNSFMGFVVENTLNSQLSKKRVNRALVYAKASYMWKDYNASGILDVANKSFEIHATVHVDGSKADEVKAIPPYIHNHGILSGQDLQKLLTETKLFIGIGFPYEGPAPLEAIANGCVFLNPSFSPPKNKLNNWFFNNKPNERGLTSQSPYAEVYIGKPHVWTLDVFNSTALREAVEEISKADAPEPYLPFEFQCEGMLQRLSTYISNQDFCNKSHSWPPKSSLLIRVSKTAQSCKARCMADDLICEPSWFPHLNSKDVLEKAFNITCSSKVKAIEDIFVPAVNPASKICLTQTHPELFSCVGQKSTLQRICPCRTYIKGQVALCKEWL